MVFHERIPSRLELVPRAISTILSKLKNGVYDGESIFYLKLSLEEAITNAIRHGNKLNPALSVDITIEEHPGSISITVQDEGAGFDYAHTPDPTRHENLKKTSGRGVFLIRNLMDEVRYSDGGRTLTMIKRFKEGAGR